MRISSFGVRYAERVVSQNVTSNWLRAEHPPNELKNKVGAVPASWGLPLSTGENEMLKDMA